MTEHFSIAELINSDTANRLMIDNSPPKDVWPALEVLAEGLEAVRLILGSPMRVNSGYRSPELNVAVRGVKTSAHSTGYAADFICPGYGTPLEITRRIAASSLAFDQCIQEGTWVHISFAPAMRREVLTAHFGQGGATYTKGT